MPDQTELAVALGDVRRAYRLLWFYQERIFDIIRPFVGEFETLRFYMWRSNSANPMDASTNPLSRSPWSAFPLMNVSYLYRSGDDPNHAKPGDWLLDIRVISDSGYSDDVDDRLQADPDTFPGVEASETRINLYVFYCTEEIKGNWLKDIWTPLDWPEPDGKAVEAANKPVKMVGISLNISDLPGREAVQNAATNFKRVATEALGVLIS
jgi:hypothetical protein